MAKMTDTPSPQDYSSGVKKILVLGKDGVNMASVTNPLPTDAVVTVDSMSITAEMKVDSGHDLYEAENVTRVAALQVSFDLVAGLTLAKIQSVENKTQGWIYNTKGATVTTTGITLVAANQNTGYPVIAVGDEIEVVYRDTSRLTDKTQFTKLTNGTTTAAIDAANTARTTGTIVVATQNVGADGTVNPTGSLNTNAPFSKLTDGSQDADIIVNNAIGDSTTKLGVASEVVDFDTSGTNDFTGAIGFLGASSNGAKPILTNTDGKLDIVGSVTTDVETGLAKDLTLTDGSQLSRAMGIYNATEPSLSDTDQAQLQLNDKGQLKVTGGASSVTAQYTSPSSFTATYTSSTTLTLSALSGFSITDSSQLVYIKVIPASGDAAIYVNGSDGVTMTVSSNVVTIAGAGTPFASGDVYEVGINALPFELDASTQSMKTSSLTNVWNQYTHPQTIVTAQDLTAAYADFGPEIDMRGFTHLSVYIITDVNDSENVTLKLLGKHTSAGTDEFELNGGTTQALWTTGASDSKVQYEFNVKGTPFIQLQSIAGTTGYTPAYLTGGSSAEGTFGTWAAVTDGSFRITIDGTARNIDAIDFSGDGSMADVAATIQAAIRAATGSTETCVWSTDHFIISSVLDASTSAITVTSTSTGTVGTDISGAGAADWMDCDSGNGTVTALAGTIGDLTISITKIWKGE
jgi:hypothetical protein